MPTLDTTNFSGNLDSSVTDTQKLAERVDQLTQTPKPKYNLYDPVLFKGEKRYIASVNIPETFGGEFWYTIRYVDEAMNVSSADVEWVLEKDIVPFSEELYNKIQEAMDLLQQHKVTKVRLRRK